MLKTTILPYIAQIQARELTNRELAAKLNVSEAYLCRTLRLLGVKRDPLVPPTDLVAARRRHREQVANTLSVEAAAAAANCSTRTIYRYKHKA